MKIERVEYELECEKEQKYEVEKQLFYKLFLERMRDKTALPLVSLSDGVPEYKDYGHLLEDPINVRDLLELANEELRNKAELLRKV